MSDKINKQYFSKEQVEAGEFKQLLDFLMESSYGVSKYYNDIHIKPEDCGAFIIEWQNIPWDKSFGGHFEYIDEDDEEVIKKITYPDGSYDWILPEYEEEARQNWVKNNHTIK